MMLRESPQDVEEILVESLGIWESGASASEKRRGARTAFQGALGEDFDKND